MPSLRVADQSDVPALARIRAIEWETEQYWMRRIRGYLDGTLSPRHALPPRTCYVALDDDAAIGFAAGHLTQRFGCAGEIQWINVLPEWRRKGVASALLRALGGWFVSEQARRVCVDAEPSDSVARAFYMRHGATDLNKHWLVWDDISALQH